VRAPGGRHPAALTTGLLLVGVTSGMTAAYIGLLVSQAPWPTAAAGLVLVAIAYLCREREWVTALLLGAGLPILLAWIVVVGGGFLVSQF
jgi:hypothetical protein